MATTSPTGTKVPDSSPDVDAPGRRLIGANATDAEIRLIDVAVALEGKPNRAHFILEHVLDAAQRTLKQHGVDLPTPVGN